MAKNENIRRWQNLQCWHSKSWCSKVSLLIGQHNPDALMHLEIIQSREQADALYATKTALGWTLYGPVWGDQSNQQVTCSFITNTELGELCIKVLETWHCMSTWHMVIQASQLKIWKQCQRGKPPRGMTAVKQDPPKLPDNRLLAKRRLASLKTRLQRDDNLRVTYSQQMNELLKKRVSSGNIRCGIEWKGMIPSLPSGQIT